MKERFSEDYFFIKEVIHYLRNGNNSQKAEYKEKLLNRHKDFITKVIKKKIKSDHSLEDDVFNDFCCKLFDLKYLEKYRGDAGFMTYIYPEILASIRKVMPKSNKKKKKEKEANEITNRDQAVNDAAQREEDYKIGEEGDFSSESPTQYSCLSKGMRILEEDLEEFTPRQDNQEHLLGIKDLRAKLDQAIAVSILKMSNTHPQDVRIFVMNLCAYSWDEIAGCIGINVNAARKRYNRSDGILDKFSALLIKTLWENYKIDFQTVSRNLNALMDIE